MFNINQLFFGHQDVKYPEYLDLRPFMSQSQGEPLVYGLYAVLVHSGFSCHAGHYFCYIKVQTLLQATLIINLCASYSYISYLSLNMTECFLKSFCKTDLKLLVPLLSPRRAMVSGTR